MATKRKLEEQRKKEEEERLAAVHKDFLDSFSDAPKLDKAWVKAGTAESERKGMMEQGGNRNSDQKSNDHFWITVEYTCIYI